MARASYHKEELITLELSKQAKIKPASMNGNTPPRIVMTVAEAQSAYYALKDVLRDLNRVDV